MQIVNVKYLCQLPDVAFNRPLPGTHPLRDLTAGEAVGETVENINLAWSEGHLGMQAFVFGPAVRAGGLRRSLTLIPFTPFT